MPKVLIADKLSPLAKQVFDRRAIDADERVGISPGELAAAIGDYDGLVVRSTTKVTADLLAAAGNLKIIGRAGIGIDNIDIDAATAAGIIVMNTPFGNAITTAEHAIAMIAALARQIPQADRSTRAGKWEKTRFMGSELTGKTLGVVGCGNIGSIVADRAQGLKMRVVAYDPFLSEERAAQINVEKLDLDALFARADIITLHTPLTDQTRGIIDAAAIAKMRSGVRIVNCARGGLVVEQDLLAALQSGHVAGAALDVLEHEPAHENPLFEIEQVIFTPHLGASTLEAQENVAIQVAEQISDYLLSGAVVNAINMASVTAEEAPKLRPYLRLAEQLGGFAGQITESAIKSVMVEFEGLAADINPRPVVAAILQGLLSPLLASVNMVNAPAIAQQRGIDVSSVQHDRPCDYQSCIRLTVTTETQTRAVSGTLFGRDKPRIVAIKGVAIEAELAPHMVYIENNDRPGLIGHLGTVLGDAGVNIATFHLGRNTAGGDAIALVEVDQPLPEGVLREIGESPYVIRSKQLQF